jgi:hypothetical protein
VRTPPFPRFGAEPLLNVSREDLKSIIVEMGAKNLSKSRIKLTVAPIRELYNRAIDDRHQLQNLAARMGRFLKDKTDRRLKINQLNAAVPAVGSMRAATAGQSSGDA